MKAKSAYVKAVTFELGYGGCRAPERPEPMLLPGGCISLPRAPRPITPGRVRPRR